MIQSIPIRLIIYFLFFITGWSAAFTEEAIKIPRTSTPPVIDGKIDEETWKMAYKTDIFRTVEPYYDRVPKQKTTGFFTYDGENIYFALRCFDNDPQKIVASVSNRDTIFGEDWAGIILDTFNDNQSGFGFVMNPLGIQGDGMMDYNGNFQETQDFVWYSKGQIDSEGYSIEGRIPLKSLRFPSGKTLTMRLAFLRQVVRDSETITSPPMFADKGSIIVQSKAISVQDLKYKRVVEVLPALTYANRQELNQDELETAENDAELSITAKLGLTSDLTLDATINPDFSQVESDAGQVDVNLRYDLFFSEKRPFFLEGEEHFRFSGNTEEAPLLMMVHTRRIINPDYGFKLTGKLGRKNSLSAIFARDNIADEEMIHHPGFLIFRLRHALKQDSYVGGFYTGRLDNESYNHVAGSDGHLRITPASIAEYHVFTSFSRNDQDSSQVNGHALALRYNYGNETFILDTGFQDISDHFQVDTGFITRKNISRFALFSMLRFYPKSTFFKRIEPFYWSYHIYDKEWQMFETVNLFTLRFWLPGSANLRFDGLLANEVYQGLRFNRSGFGLQTHGQVSKQLFYAFFFRSTGAVYYDEEDPYQGFGTRLGAELAYQPLETLSTGLSLSYVDFFRESTREKVYDYGLIRSRTTFQPNKYLFLRGIIEYNTYWKKLTADVLASFTYIPGTVVYAGYGSALEKIRWQDNDYVDSDRFLETKRGFFFKISYLLRL